MKNMRACGLYLCLLLVLLFCMPAAPAIGEEINRNGFRITYNVNRTVGSREKVVYTNTPTPYPSSDTYILQSVVTVVLAGKVANELFRNLASVNLYFHSADTEGNVNEKVITISNLGPHENQEFSVSLGQKIDVPDFNVSARLTRLLYTYKDGKSEEIRF